MKKTNKENRKAGNTILCGLLGLGLCLANVAKAADWHWGTINVPSDLNSVVNQTLTSTNGVALDVPPNTDLLVMPACNGASATTSNVIWGFNLSPDTTNFTTTAPLQVTNAAAGTTNVVGYAVFTKQQLQGSKKIRFGYSSTTSLATMTNNTIYYGFYY